MYREVFNPPLEKEELEKMKNKKGNLAIAVSIIALTISATIASAAPAAGPLVRHPNNPHYFMVQGDPDQKAVFLTGSHVWNNIMDWGNSYPPPLFDFTAHLNWLKQNNHNFTRGWVWENTVLVPYDPDIYFYPFLFERPGPGTAHDGRPKFDITQVSTTYLDRVRNRVIQARDEDIYISVMLFQPINYGSKSSNPPDDELSWWTHPFQRDNNINGIDGDPDGDGEGWESETLPWDTYYNPPISQAVTDLQKAYVSEVIDQLNDLDNLIWEIGNEGIPESLNWQNYMVNHIKSYEANKPKQHLVWMSSTTGSGPEVPEFLLTSDADVVAFNNRRNYFTNPFVDPRKIIIADTDHGYNNHSNISWVWKCFTRTAHPILMDPYYNDNPWLTPGAHHVQDRLAMGDTLDYANRMDLAAMTGQHENTTTPSSAGYCLFTCDDPTVPNPTPNGEQYLTYQPGSGAFTLNLPAGNYDYEWFNPNTHTIAATDTLNWAGGNKSFTPPFSGYAVLYIVRQGRPVAVIDANPTKGYSPLTVNFDGSNSYDTDGNIVSYEWDFTNDGSIDATGVTTSHVYSEINTYVASLKVTDNQGKTDTATVSISVVTSIGDFDIDIDVDQEDFGHLQKCMTGTGIPQNDPDCLNARLDIDEDVDLDDFNIFQNCMSGANVPQTDPACMPN
jgi:hypothetical protein